MLAFMLRRTVTHIVVLALALGACGDGDNPQALPNPAPYTALLGTWTFTITDTAGCAGAGTLPSRIELEISQSADDTNSVQLLLVGNTSTWTAPGTGISGVVTGVMPRTLPLNAIIGLIEGVPDPTPSLHYAQIAGILTETLTFKGVLDDPLSLDTTYYRPLLTSAVCGYQVRGHHS